ncbi:MAG: hypothetical protein ACR2KT_15955 [Methylocella sp.]
MSLSANFRGSLEDRVLSADRALPATDFAPASTARRYDGGTSLSRQNRLAAYVENPGIMAQTPQGHLEKYSLEAGRSAILVAAVSA